MRDPREPAGGLAAELAPIHVPHPFSETPSQRADKMFPKKPRRRSQHNPVSFPDVQAATHQPKASQLPHTLPSLPPDFHPSLPLSLPFTSSITSRSPYLPPLITSLLPPSLSPFFFPSLSLPLNLAGSQQAYSCCLCLPVCCTQVPQSLQLHPASSTAPRVCTVFTAPRNRL